jgi:hypothetical protein
MRRLPRFVALPVRADLQYSPIATGKRRPVALIASEPPAPCDIVSLRVWAGRALTARAAMLHVMEDDVAVDAALWLIIAVMIGWVVLGCALTARHRRSSAQRVSRR